MKEDQSESTETAALTKGNAGDAFAAVASKKALQVVVVKDFESEAGDSASQKFLALSV